MSYHKVVLTVAAYASKAAAARDFDAVGRARDGGEYRQVAAAVLGKGLDGALTIDRSDAVEPDVAWGGALLGAALLVLAAPVGILFLPPVVTGRSGWARVAALVAHCWQNIPQEKLHLMSNLLESRPAGLVIVAVDHTREQVGALLSDATATILSYSTTVELDADFTNGTNETDAGRYPQGVARENMGSD
jgi:hypothetical protein